MTGNESAAYNPLDLLDPGSERFAEDATALADAIVSDPPGEVREAHWNEEAVALLSGLILLCASSEPPARRNLARVRAYLTQPPETFHQLLEAMQASDAAGGLVARAANRRLGQNEREAASVLSTAQRHTHFLDSASIAEATSRTDFRFADLARSISDGYHGTEHNRRQRLGHRVRRKRWDGYGSAVAGLNGVPSTWHSAL